MLVHFSSLPVENLTLNWLSNFWPVTHLNLLKVGVVPEGRRVLPYKRLMGDFPTLSYTSASKIPTLSYT